MQHDVSKTGLKDSCAFHTIPGFQALDNRSLDIMHIWFEGIFTSDLVALIKLFIRLGYFTLFILNERMENCNWIRNKPRNIEQNDSNKDNLRMTASEMYEFVTNFGVLVGDLVPENEPAWRVYIN